MITIRSAALADLDAVLAVGRAAWIDAFRLIAGDDFVTAGLARWWTPDSLAPEIAADRVLVAERREQVVAMACFVSRPEQLVVRRLYVLPTAQGTGVGSALMTDLVARAATRGLSLSFLDGNRRAQTFYEAHGFRVTGLVPDPDGPPHQVRMERPSHAATGSSPSFRHHVAHRHIIGGAAS